MLRSRTSAGPPGGRRGTGSSSGIPSLTRCEPALKRARFAGPLAAPAWGGAPQALRGRAIQCSSPCGSRSERHSSTGRIAPKTITSLKELAQKEPKLSISPTPSAPTSASG